MKTCAPCRLGPLLKGLSSEVFLAWLLLFVCVLSLFAMLEAALIVVVACNVA